MLHEVNATNLFRKSSNRIFNRFIKKYVLVMEKYLKNDTGKRIKDQNEGIKLWKYKKKENKIRPWCKNIKIWDIRLQFTVN